MATYPSITESGKTEDFNLQVSRGKIPGHSLVNIFGYNSSFSSTASVAIWEGGSSYIFPPAASIMYLYGSAGDTATIRINGLGADDSIQTESVTLNGTSLVPTTKTFHRINEIIVSAGSPSSTVILGTSGSSLAYARINPSIGRSQMSVYSVPSGYTFYLQRIDGFAPTQNGTTTWVSYEARVTSPSSGITYDVAQSDWQNYYNIRRYYPVPYLQGSDIQFKAHVQAGSGPISLFVEGVLISNDVG